MFVKWECGCTGLKLDDLNILVTACDGDGHGHTYSFMKDRRDLSEKVSHPLPKDERDEMISELGHLIHKGQDFETIAGLLFKA